MLSFFSRCSHFDVDHDASAAYCKSSSGDGVEWLRVTISSRQCKESCQQQIDREINTLFRQGISSITEITFQEIRVKKRKTNITKEILDALRA